MTISRKRVPVILFATIIMASCLFFSPSQAKIDYNHAYILPGSPDNGDELGTVLAAGDFSGNGHADLVIASPHRRTTLDGGGEVVVIFGDRTSSGLGNFKIIDHNTGELAGRVETFYQEPGMNKGAHFGAAVAVGDFDRNGYADLAIGIAGSVTYQKGQVAVIYSDATTPLDTGNSASVQVFYEGDIGGTSEDGDQFGMSLCAGDFNGDGYDDLAVGIPNEDDGGVKDAGAVRVIYGSATGLDLGSSISLRQGLNSIPGTSETGDSFGMSLCAGDFNGDGYSDLAVSAPYEDHGSKTDAGMIWLFFGTSKGLLNFASTAHTLTQNDLNVGEGASNNERFGWAMAAGDINGDTYDDLVVGIPYEDSGGKNSTGEVNIFYGGTSGISSMTSLNQVIDEDTGSMGGVAEAEDLFGYSVAVGDVNGDGYSDVAIGVPHEKYNAIPEAGAAHLLFGSPMGLAINGYVHREDQAPVGGPESGDRWGESVLLADTDGDGLDDFFVGVVSEDDSLGAVDIGTVHRLPGEDFDDGVNHKCTTVIRRAVDYMKDYTGYQELKLMLEELEADSNARSKDVFTYKTIGHSFWGKPIWAIKLSDHPSIDDEAEPDVLFTAGLHAREWLPTEAAIELVQYLYDTYYDTNACGHAEIVELVENHEIWVIPLLNPDGRIKDDPNAGDPTQYYGSSGWRLNNQLFTCEKNRLQYWGIDLNRSFSYDFATSGNMVVCGSNVYNGGSPFAATEARVMKNFVNNHMFSMAMETHGPDQWIASPSGNSGMGNYIAEEANEIYSSGMPYEDLSLSVRTSGKNGGIGQFYGWLWQEADSGVVDNGSLRAIQTLFLEVPFRARYDANGDDNPTEIYGCEADGMLGQYACQDGSNKYHPSSGKLVDWVIHKYISMAKHVIHQSDMPFVPLDFPALNPRPESPVDDLAVVGAKISDVDPGLEGAFKTKAHGPAYDELSPGLRRITWNVQNCGVSHRDFYAEVEIWNRTDGGASHVASFFSSNVPSHDTVTFTYDYDFSSDKDYEVEVRTSGAGTVDGYQTNNRRVYIFKTTTGGIPVTSAVDVMEFLSLDPPPWSPVDIKIEINDDLSLTAKGPIHGQATLHLIKRVLILSGPYAGRGYEIFTYTLDDMNGMMYGVLHGDQFRGTVRGDIQGTSLVTDGGFEWHLSSVRGAAKTGIVSLTIENRNEGEEEILSGVPMRILENVTFSGNSTGTYSGPFNGIFTGLWFDSFNEGFMFGSYECETGDGQIHGVEVLGLEPVDGDLPDDITPDVDEVETRPSNKIRLGSLTGHVTGIFHALVAKSPNGSFRTTMKLEHVLKSVQPPCDYDRDGDVDGEDLSRMAIYYSQNDSRADLNHNGVVDKEDVKAFGGLFGGVAK